MTLSPRRHVRRAVSPVLVIFATVVAFLIPAGLTSSAEAKPSKYPITLGAITFTFPSKPMFTKLQANTAAGTLDVPTYSIEGGAVAASGVSLPGISKSSADKTLQDAANGAAANIKGTIRTSKTDVYVGFPSVTIIIDVTGGTVFQRIVTDTKTKTLVQVIGVVAQSKATTPPKAFTSIEASARLRKA